MSTIDTSGGGGPLGPVIDTGLGGEVGEEQNEPFYPSAFLYNGKTILLPKPPRDFRINPAPPRTVNYTLTGAVETILQPRMGVEVYCSFGPFEYDLPLRVQMDNLWQWAVRGNAFRFLFDYTRDVSTTISSAVAGAGSVTVASTSNIVEDREYIIVGGPNYQLVIVSSVVGSVVTLTDTLDYDFPSGAIFRERYLWDGCILDEGAKCWIVDVFSPNPKHAWMLEMEFYQAGTG